MLKIPRHAHQAIAQTIFVSAAIGMSFLLSFAGETSSPTISAKQFAIGGVTLGADKVLELIRAFGEPLEVRSEETEAGPDTAKIYVFKGIEAYTQGSELLNLQCTNPNYATPDGAKVLDRLDTIFKIYGKTEVSDRGGYGLIGYNVGETDATLLFFIKDDRVFKIQLWFNYT
jgi:hypothetical protein